MFRSVFQILTLAILYDLQLVDSRFLRFERTKNSLNAITSLVSGAYPPFEYLKLYANDHRTWQNLADNKLQSISVEQYLKSDNWFTELRHNQTFDNQIQDLISVVRKIETIFDSYLQYKQNFSRHVKENQFSNASYQGYLHDVFRSGFYGVAELLDDASLIIAPTSSEFASFSLVRAVVTNILKSENFCETNLSNMQKIGQLLGHFTLVEVKGLLAMLFGYDVKEWFFRDDFSLSRHIEQEKSLTRYNRMVNSFRLVLIQSSNELHGCSPNEHVNGLTYFELEGLFQTYLIQESYIASMFECQGNCESGSGKQNFKCLKRNALLPKDGEVCTKTYQCDGVLQGCKPLYRNEYYDYPKVCFARGANTTRRYDFLTYDSNDYRKCDDELVQLDDVTVRFGHFARKCIYCQCTCVRGDRNKIKYRFSLQPSVAEYKKNYVVTGARFKKTDDGLIYIQIQQGQLLPHGGIDPNSIEWIIPSLKKISTQEISWKFRRVNLDSLKVPDSHVVVGVTLNKSSIGMSNYFELQVMHLPYNATTGSLDKAVKPQITISHNTNQSISRRELYLSSKDIPTRYHGEEHHSPDNSYLLFQPTALTKDGGQSTIPFIDAQKVNFKVPTPLSGVGLSYRGNWESGGFLGLKLFSYNFTHDLIENHMTKKDFVNRIR